MRILVCDDEQKRFEEIARSIRDAGQPVPDALVGEDLTKVLTTLFKGIRSCLENPAQFKGMQQTPFDGADVVILDNNLAHLEVPGTRLTAETIAGYVRAFTGAAYVVSLNLNPDVDFDLRYLVGDYSTRADLALNTNHLTNPGLWTGDLKSVKDMFLPWYWPRLSFVAQQRAQQIDFAHKHLDQSVAGALAFDDVAISFLSRHAQGALSPEAVTDDSTTAGSVPFNKVTFRDVFISKDRSLPIKDERQNLSEAERNGNAILRNVLARVVAADMDLWFRRDVIAPQEPLVDIPHLLVRFPFLLGDGAADPVTWNNAAHSSIAPYGIEKGLYDKHIAPARFEQAMWTKTACFWWSRLKMDEQLNSLLLDAKQTDWADVVFCEDRSAFLEREPKAGTPPSEFPAEFEGAWQQRYVARVASYKYSPRSRLAM